MYIEINSTYGSITHYYHFFYGVMIPLLLYSIKNKKEEFILNDDLGPMLKILYELPLNVLYKCNIGKKKRFYIEPLDTLKSKYDDKKRINYSDIKLINQYFKKNLPFYITPNKTYDIILIDRQIDTKYKLMNYSCLKNNKKRKKELIRKLGSTSGKERRYIKNHQEIVKSLEKKFSNKFINISLENLPLFYQYYLFSNAKLVIAQHGAALSNVIFMKKNTNVIEIISKEKIDEGEDTFKNLSKICKLNHYFIKKKEENPTINPKILIDVINKLLS